MLNYYILDDEQHAVDALNAMLKKKFSQQVSFAGSSTSAAVAIREIELLLPDILFLDVEMPEMNGIDLLKHFPLRDFYVIFTTAHEKYALPALKAAATDYLVKPLSPQDVHDALKKCAARAPVTATKENADIKKISISTGQELLLLNIRDIIRVEGENNYSVFYFSNRPRLTVSRTLKEFEEQLSVHGFCRVHQSHLINLSYVASVKTGDDIVVMQSGDHVEISRRRKAQFLQLLKNL